MLQKTENEMKNRQSKRQIMNVFLEKILNRTEMHQGDVLNFIILMTIKHIILKRNNKSRLSKNINYMTFAKINKKV